MKDHEAKAREIVQMSCCLNCKQISQLAGEQCCDNAMRIFPLSTELLVSAIVTALREAEERSQAEGQNDIWLWLDDETTDDPILNAIVKSMMARHKRAATIRGRSESDEHHN